LIRHRRERPGVSTGKRENTEGEIEGQVGSGCNFCWKGRGEIDVGGKGTRRKVEGS